MGKVVKLVDNFDSLYQYVTNEGRTFWFRSNMDAPKYKVRRDATRGVWWVRGGEYSRQVKIHDLSFFFRIEKLLPILGRAKLALLHAALVVGMSRCVLSLAYWDWWWW